MEQEERFFSRKHVYSAIWTILIVFIGFIGGLMYQQINGPQKVTIDSESTRNKPLYVRINNESAAAIKSQTNNGDVKKDLKSLQKRIEDISLYSKYISGQKSSFNSPKVDAFKLPPNIKGYYVVPLLGVAQAACVPQQLKTGDPLIVGFSLKDRLIINKSTPLFVRVILKKPDSQLVQVFEQKYDMKEGQNNILADIYLDAGKYEITYGYYLLNELTSEYPNYYSKGCRFRIL